jgi:hypothetical protein
MDTASGRLAHQGSMTYTGVAEDIPNTQMGNPYGELTVDIISGK